MKIAIISLFVSYASLAQMPKLPTTAALKDFSKQVVEACKEDKSKIVSCKSYTEINELKACLMLNESKLSEKCKSSLKLLK